MKFYRYLFVPMIFAFSQFAFGSSTDTLYLIGGSSYNFSLGWFGEAWRDSAQRWCGDTVVKDLTIDTTVSRDTQEVVLDSLVPDIARVRTSQRITVDSLSITTVTINTKIAIRHAVPPDSMINIDTIIIDSIIQVNCSNTNFVTDTGGLTPGTQYINYFYKFRNYYAQLPLLWSGWAGIDASAYKYLMIVYKGLLPTHRIQAAFYYASWGGLADTTKDKNRGDGVAILSASPAEWSTQIIQIPDSVDMYGITGLNLNIGNALGFNAQTSEVGNLKIDRVALLVATTKAGYSASPRNSLKDRFQFIPKTAGKVSISVYSLNGEQLSSKSIGVEANKLYSVRQLMKRNSGEASPQVRLVKIKGAGVDINQRIW